MHIQLSGPKPQALKQTTRETEEFHPLVWGAAFDLMPNCRSSPEKRQLSLEELGELDDISGEQRRRVRKDVKQDHKYNTYDEMKYEGKYCTEVPHVSEHVALERAVSPCKDDEPMVVDWE